MADVSEIRGGDEVLQNQRYHWLERARHWLSYGDGCVDSDVTPAVDVLIND